MTESQQEFFYILSLDGGGSLGVFTLGVLEGVANLVGKPLHKQFDLIYGTSTGSIIGSLIALGKDIQEISELYNKYIPRIMGCNTAQARSQALRNCAKSNEIFGERMFNAFNFKTFLGVVATRSDYNRPMVFKSSVELAYSGKADLVAKLLMLL
jgi:uncharacterized protein